MDYPEISKDLLPDKVKEIVGNDEFVIETFVEDQDEVLTEAFGMDPLEREIHKMVMNYEMRKMADALNQIKTGKKPTRKRKKKYHSVIDELNTL